MPNLALVVGAFIVASCSKSPPTPKGPVPDITVGPGLSVIIDTEDFLLVSVATLKGKEATPTYSGRLHGGGGTNPAGEKPEGADVRLRFLVTPGMPPRGEAPIRFDSAAEKKIVEITNPNAAEYIYTGGQVTLTVTSDGKTVVLSPK